MKLKLGYIYSAFIGLAMICLGCSNLNKTVKTEAKSTIISHSYKGTHIDYFWNSVGYIDVTFPRETQSIDDSVFEIKPVNDTLFSKTGALHKRLTQYGFSSEKFVNKMDFVFAVAFSESTFDSISRVRPKTFANNTLYDFDHFQIAKKFQGEIDQFFRPKKIIDSIKTQIFVRISLECD